MLDPDTLFDAFKKMCLPASEPKRPSTKGVVGRAMPQGDILGFAPALCLTREEGDLRHGALTSDDADAKAFAERCEQDRHHFGFIISPQNAADVENVRAFTRELMADVERDFGTKLG